MNRRKRSVVTAGWLGLALVVGGVSAAPSGAAVDAASDGWHASVTDRAVEIVRESSRSADGALRASAIEAALGDRDLVVPLIQLGLDDDDPRVRYRALTAIGELKLAGLGASAVGYLDDPSPSVRAGAIYAASANGRQVDRTPLAEALMRPLASSRINAAEVLASLGDPSARPMIEAAAGLGLPQATVEQERAVQVKLAESMVRLGDNSARDVIRAAMFEPAIEVRVMSIDLLGRLNDRSMRPALVRLLRSETREVRLAAAAALLRLGDPSGVAVLQSSAGYSADQAATELRTTLGRLDPASPLALEIRAVLADPARLRASAAAVRAQAAYGLGLTDDTASAEALAGLLSDPMQAVRLAAAGAVLGSSSAGR
ncbi:MAG: HEAT repeat domain-containing protein [Planctomycetota bacterium]